MWALVYLAIFLVSCLLSVLLVPFVRRVALAQGLVDHPGPRKVHQNPTPLLGGAAILVALLGTVLFGYLAFIPFGHLLPVALHRHLAGVVSVLPRLSLILFGGVLIFLFGLVDDLVGIRARWKLLGQAAIALLLFASGLRISLFLPGTAVPLLLTVGWLLFVTNSFNLLDNMDGLASGVAFIAAALFFLYAQVTGALFVSSLLAAFAGAVLGFLVYNRPPATIFLGEAGSTLLGYFLAVTGVTLTYYRQDSPSYLSVLAPVFILAIPIFDTLSVIAIRRREGRSIFTAGKDHLSHRLVRFGFSSREAVSIIYLLSLGLGLPALVLSHLSFAGSLILLLQGCIFLAVLSFLESRGNAS
ncbi:MAG TPA: MraY family glycosyltransferase [bacterium]|uniref:Putative undecaprenyl-phosphate N-acetylglucosaminyl 1-phosphate transferase n=1 Tax=candidate division TA06 bacterium ADurb.Bin417 TaxID=1852828 RepID=A0A1V5MIC6_UNCT6|nr:MAG: putative undecaprenyl-phosphate N-acetylglucosaminyl 1-phosphate transferase [candidate division TA06 bacterium ADurb.Bin417]HNQ36135.1 MraY family glycosyltransferase [bacterium]HNS49146.1 MraY family glycosyltransferase [bacterium]